MFLSRIKLEQKILNNESPIKIILYRKSLQIYLLKCIKIKGVNIGKKRIVY